ncbi:WxL domain-containing protein [Listeria booriae]|uniref:WxL domain-containing protein n=1 Tax=Listeria booriae TaxID=1552123 RepID=UPI001628807F|nr:WxL domain-containing protein [Listeria booriae]MBC2369255.1 WxL domain-containing protein [Listeria booriae]
MKNLTKVLTVGAITVATLFGANTFAHADTTTSTGKIKIEADDSAVTPLNPTNPDSQTPATPDSADPDNTGTGNTGALTIDFLSNIDFGTQKVSGQSEKYYAENKNPYIQVTDKRGTGAGWTLKGAEMSLTDGEVRTQSDNQSAAPTTSDITLNGNTQSVLSAEANAGMGTWLDVYPGTEGNNENVSLYVPAGNLAGDYSTAITWTLEDSPSAE